MNNFDLLKNDIEQYAYNVVKTMATQTREELCDAAKYAIEEFYRDYTPKSGSINTSYQWEYGSPSGVPLYYKRHYDNFLTRSYKKYYHNNHNKYFSGGVELSPDLMTDYYQGDINEVFDMVYSGFHGVSSGFINPRSFTATRVMSPSPIQIIQKKQNDLIKNIDKLQNKAMVEAQLYKYNVLFK